MPDNEMKSTGPRTEEGKARSSQNALKHGLFAKTILIQGESQEEFDRHYNQFKGDYKPVGATEEDLVLLLATTSWRRRRLPGLEAATMDNAIAAGQTEFKFLATFGIYQHRLNRTFDNALEQLKELQAVRRRNLADDLEVAAMLRCYFEMKHIPWHPADDGFVFSTAFLDKMLARQRRINEAREPGGPFIFSDEDLTRYMSRQVA